MNHKTYYIFDLDGTLTDPVVGITTCVQYALAAYGIHEPDRSKLTKFIGPPLVSAFMEFYGVDAHTAQGMLEKYRERFAAVGMYENELYHFQTSDPLGRDPPPLRHFTVFRRFGRGVHGRQLQYKGRGAGTGAQSDRIVGRGKKLAMGRRSKAAVEKRNSGKMRHDRGQKI